MMNSFRLRLALLSAIISGLVVVAFGSLAWWSLSRSMIKGLDEDLRHFGYRVTLRSGPNVDTQRLEASLADVYGSKQAETRFLTLLNSRSRVIYSSSKWPAELAATDFPASDTKLSPQPIDQFRISTDKKSNPRVVSEPRFYHSKQNGTNYRIGVFSNTDIILVLGVDLEQHTQEMQKLRRAFLVALPGALILVALGAAFVGWRGLTPIETMGRDMENISARDLSHRLDVGGVDREFERIITNYNEMLERLERSFHQATRFSADASHELKTPLTIMQGSLEKGIAQCEDNSEAQAILIEVLEQTGKQRSILESLLLLARADAGKLQVSQERINLSEHLDSWLEDAGFLAEQRNIKIESDIAPDLWLDADPIALQQVAHNLFSNAVRYNKDDGEIECRLTASDNHIEWTVANTGEPIRPEDHERIFERFYRAKSSGKSGGIGLGLSLVKEIITAHGGTVDLDPHESNRNRFRISLPL